jgi:HlyD family secretion protein
MKNSTQEHDDPARLGIGNHQKRRRWRALWLLLFILVIGMTATWAVVTTQSSAKGLGYLTQAVHQGDLNITISATGNLEPTNQVDVGSEISGTVKSVFATENDRVTVGQVLAALDTAKLEAQVLQSKAALASARAKVMEAEATVVETRNQLSRLEKVRELGGDKAVSRYDLDAAEAALARAKAEVLSSNAAVEQAQATLKIQQTDLSKAVIRSPINGIVLARSVEPGQTVAASLQAPVLFTLAEDLARMELHVDVDEADVGQVQPGQPAHFSVDAYPDRTFQAEIITVHYGSQITDSVVTYEAVLKVHNSDLSLRPGMTATADITVKQVTNALLVPNSALRFTPASSPGARASRGGLLDALLPRPPRRHRSQAKAPVPNGQQQRVWTLKEGKPQPIRISIGSTDGVVTEVTGGNLPQGTAVIVEARQVSS